jgi:hypothetical protein
MMYIFYPYYWTTPNVWAQLQQLQDVDPLHARFLQAGAARVVVPVRPGYENWLNYYVQHGEPYGEAEPPGVGEEGFLDIIDELTELQDYDGEERKGAVSVQNGSPTVIGDGTDFIMPDDDPDNDDREINDENRRIYIDMKPYRIAKVDSPTQITLSENYEGETKSGLPYAIGAKFVGAPWEVRLPTTLVILEKRTDTVDDLTFGDS